MKTILPFLFLFTLFISCKQDDEIVLQKNGSYDLYVSGKDNSQLCYWKNGIKHNITNVPADTPSKIFVNGNDVYIKGKSGFWKNGNYTTYFQAAGLSGNQDMINIFDFYMENGNIYFVGYTWSVNNPAPDKYEFCYWKNGVKTFLFKDTFTYNNNCTITEFNSDVYVGANKNLNGFISQGYFKNTTFTITDTSIGTFTYIVSNDNNVYLTGIHYYTNVLTGVKTNFSPTPITGDYGPALDGNDVYINARANSYYKNANMIVTSNPFPTILDLKVTDQNIYMIRTSNNGLEYKVYINDVETQSIPNPNGGSSYNNITVIKN
ncbi:hypothetical protein [Chryseobacterium sp. HR92]|uniref:hypothetical protein n=1 Tax=Chryseobacterium sp. HR92 TaxID=3094839 RepID=UPI00388FAC3E|nr:hypothetical protein SFA27_06310 [Chryseobacterium sp. HR92]